MPGDRVSNPVPSLPELGLATPRPDDAKGGLESTSQTTPVHPAQYPREKRALFE